MRVSPNASDNLVSLYYKKIEKIPESIKQADYTVQFRAYGHPETVIFEDITGVWNVGERLPVYFFREITDSKGCKWEAIDSSSRMFTVREQEKNVFQIEYKQVGSQAAVDIRTYFIRYVAQDTGSVLGVAAGMGEIRDMIPYRNTFHDYGFAEDGNTYVITEEENQSVDVAMKRIHFPGHEPNKTTGKYDSFSWMALFDDSSGEQLLPNVRGYTVEGTDLAEPYTGQIAFEKGNSVCDFRIYYPGLFYDEERNRWEAEEPGPKTFLMNVLDTNEVVDTFDLGGIPYTISCVGYHTYGTRKPVPMNGNVGKN